MRSNLEQIKQALVHPLDGPEEFLDPHGFASYLVAGRGRRYGIAELSRSVDTFGRQQGKHGAWILLP